MIPFSRSIVGDTVASDGSRNVKLPSSPHRLQRISGRKDNPPSPPMMLSANCECCSVNRVSLREASITYPSPPPRSELSFVLQHFHLCRQRLDRDAHFAHVAVEVHNRLVHSILAGFEFRNEVDVPIDDPLTERRGP